MIQVDRDLARRLNSGADDLRPPSARILRPSRPLRGCL